MPRLSQLRTARRKLDFPPFGEHADEAEARPDVVAAAPRPGELAQPDPAPAVGGGIGGHPLEPRVRGLSRCGCGWAVQQVVAERLELAQTEQAWASASGGFSPACLEPSDLRTQIVAGEAFVDEDVGCEEGRGHPPMGARGVAPQKSCVPSAPMRCRATRLRAPPLAVAAPAPTGPALTW